MTQMLTRQGNSLALVIDPALLEELQLDATTPLEVKAEGGRIIVTPQRANGRNGADADGDGIDDASFDSAVAEVTKRYEKTFKKLAE